MTTAPLQQLRAHLNRDGGIPGPEDIEAAGLVCVDGGCGVSTPTSESDLCGHYLGLIEEFKIVGRVYDKKTGQLKSGRFLIQWTENQGEVLHHQYS